MTATMTEQNAQDYFSGRDITARKQSGRKPMRTDYVYVLTFHYQGASSVLATTRKLRSAKQAASRHSGASVGFSTLLKSWWSNGDEPSFYMIERKPLVN
jgi:hypothetical protein